MDQGSERCRVKSPIIIEGPPADWKAHEKASSHVVDDEGNVNWGSAMCADPGVKKCPGCGLFMWNEGWLVQCPDCEHVFETGNRPKKVSKQ
jgi:hypothetical protein